MHGSSRCALLLFLSMMVGCSNGVTPPNGYRSNFDGADISITVHYDDPTLPTDRFEDHIYIYQVNLAHPFEEEAVTTYVADVLFGCEVVMTADGIDDDGYVQMSPESLPVECSYVSDSGVEWDISFTTVDIYWGEWEFVASLSGSFVNRAAGREDRTGTYSVHLNAT